MPKAGGSILKNNPTLQHKGRFVSLKIRASAKSKTDSSGCFGISAKVRKMYPDSLTTERLRKKFKNNFNLCNFAINIGRNIIMGGTQSSLGEILIAVETRADEEAKK